ncbi:MAG: hypothetical protein KC418_22470, partial [Anaerolineales bacterium]|nr:hypothetical protein [Anaerolineales bacterium]
MATVTQMNLITMAIRAAKEAGRATEVVETPRGLAWSYEEEGLSRLPRVRQVWSSRFVVRLLSVEQLHDARDGDILYDDVDDSYWQAQRAEGRLRTRRLPVTAIMRPTPDGAILHELDGDAPLTHPEAAAELQGRDFYVAATERELLYVLLARRLPVARLTIDDELAAQGR